MWLLISIISIWLIVVIGFACFIAWVNSSKDPLIKHYNEEIEKAALEIDRLYDLRKYRVKEILFNKDYSATAEEIAQHKINLKKKEKKNVKKEK